MGECSVGIAFFTTHCNYTLIVYFDNRVLLPRSRPVSRGSSAQRWRDVRPGLTEQGSGSLSLLSGKGWHHKKKKKKKNLGRDFASNPSRRFSPPVIFASGTRAEPGPSNGLSNVRAPPSGVARKALRRGQAGPGPGEHLGLRRSGRRVELCEDSRAVQVWVPLWSLVRVSALLWGPGSGRSPAAAGVDASWPGPGGGRAGCRLWVGPWSLCGR